MRPFCLNLKSLLAPAWVLGLALCSNAALASIHKCTGPDGKVSFQDAPCGAGKDETLELRPASGPIPGSAPNAAGGGSSEAQRIEAEVLKSQAGRRKRDLEVALIPNARQAINNHLAACDAEQQRLQVKKASGRPADNTGRPFESSPRNAVAHAQWESSVSQEMAAAASTCATRTQTLAAELDALRRECSAIGCVPQ